MVSKRPPIDSEDRFVAYDPKNRTCTPADRNLIKRLAGKKGSETKKSRLRQEKASRRTTLSNVKAKTENSRISSLWESGSPHVPQLPLARDKLNTPSTTAVHIRRDLPSSCHKDDHLWTPSHMSDWPDASSLGSTTTYNSFDNNTYTPFTSPSYTHGGTPVASHVTNDFQDYFSQHSDMRYTDLSDRDFHDIGLTQPHPYGCRAFGSFDSGFQDAEPYDYNFTGLDERDDLATKLATHGAEQQINHNHVMPQRSIDKERGINDVDFDREVYLDLPTASSQVRTPSGDNELPKSASRIPHMDLNAVVMNVSPHTECPQQHRVLPMQRSAWLDVDIALVEWVQHQERHGQLCAGSSDECLDVLSKSEEARSLWNLNLSRLSPKQVLCPEQPGDVCARAKSKLKSMSSSQRMNMEGIMIKLGIAEYAAISLVLEVTALQQYVSIRKHLGSWSKGEAIVDHRLARLAPGTQSILKDLWPSSQDRACSHGFF